MNAISKRLLSWLCVIAMVLSFVPVMDLSNFAVETQAAEEEIVYGSANYEGVDAAILEQMNFGNAIDNSDEAFAEHLANKTCPVCGDISALGGWTEVDGTSAKGFGSSTEGVQVHYYYADGTETAKGNMIGFYGDTVNSTACVWLKSTQSITNTSTRAVMLSGATNTINFFGQGTITTDVGSPSYNMFQVSGGTLNLYGGNFVFVHPQNDFRQAAIRVAGTNAVINIYDEAVIGPAKVDPTKVTQNVQYTAGGTVNMFGGTIQNGVSPAWGYSGNVTISGKGTFNMYDGTISGGTFLNADSVTENVTNNATIGGNVIVGGKKTEAYYDATTTTDESTGESTTTYKANYTTDAGTFNMYGGTITGGKANNGGNGGGNVSVYNGGSVARFQGGTITGGVVQAKGGNIQSIGGTTTITGTAYITGGETTNSHGGNVMADNANATLIISGGKIEKGKTNGSSANGGNIAVGKIKNLTISGGVITDGETKGYGGNLFLSSDSASQTTPGVISITGGTFENGIANAQGGNISSSMDLTIANATITGGTGRKGGGNINMAARGTDLTLTNCTVANGWVSGAIDSDGNLSAPTGANWGGNIRSWDCDVVIDGGLIYGGMRGNDKNGKHAGNNVSCLSSVESTSTNSLNGCTLTIKGNAVIVGDINTSAPSYNSDKSASSPGTTSVILEGAPQIVTSYQLADGTTVGATYGGLNLHSSTNGSVKADISKLDANAKICLSGVALNRVISIGDANAANVAGCFSVYNNADLIATVNDSDQLVISEKPEEKPVKPEATVGGQNLTDEVWETMLTAAEIQEAALALDPTTATTCPACGATGITWVEAIKPNQTNANVTSRHYYIAADTEVTKTYNWYTMAHGKIDADGNATDSNVTVEGATMCLLLKNGETSKNIGGMMGLRNGTNGCTFNIMGEGIVTSDGSSCSDGNFGVIHIQGTNNTVNLYGGTFIYNKNCVDSSGVPNAAALYVRGTGGHTVNMYNETKIGPETQDLTTPMYNVLLKVETAKYTSTFNMYGGTIRNGVTGNSAASGNITTNYKANCTTAINIYGGSIVNGSHTEAATSTSGGNIKAAAYTKINMYGGTISGGEAKYGGNVFMHDSAVSTFNMHGGTVTGGYASAEGGNLQTYNKFVNIGQYGLIEDGEAVIGGGNISIRKYSVTTAGHILNGKAGQRGGNIDVNTLAVTVDGGVIANGTLTAATSGAHWGGNIRSWNGKVTINDGLIYGGTGAVSNTACNNIGALGDTTSDTLQPELTINGGTIIGDISTSAPKTTTTTTTDEETGEETTTTTVFEGTLVTLSGSPKILMSKEIDGKTVVPTAGFGLNLATGIEIDITNLNADAEIALTSSKGRVISAAREDAETVAGCFTVENLSNVLVAKNADDKLYITAAAAVVDAEGNKTLYLSNDEALANYTYGEEAYVILVNEAEIAEDVVVELNGSDLKLTGTGKVYGFDASNDDYKGYAQLTVEGDVQVQKEAFNGDKRYIALKESDGTWGFHRVEMVLTHVTLRTSAAGLYYKAKYLCDDMLASRVVGYGVVLSTQNMPGADFMTEADDNNQYTMIDGPLVPDENHTVATNSGSVFDIIENPNAERTAEQNVAYADMDVYANPYLAIDHEGNGTLDDVGYYVGDVENGGSIDKGIHYSLLSVLKAIDENWASYDETQQTLIQNTVNTWTEWLTDGAWAEEFENIQA